MWQLLLVCASQPAWAAAWPERGCCDRSMSASRPGGPGGEPCFAEIGPVGSSITPADRANLAALVAQADAATHQSQALQKKQPTPRLYVYGSYVDEPLMMKAGGSKYYYASNHLSSVAALAASTGAVVELY
jgi:hypothetical protein